jgi:hypothetical protein
MPAVQPIVNKMGLRRLEALTFCHPSPGQLSRYQASPRWLGKRRPQGGIETDGPGISGWAEFNRLPSFSMHTFMAWMPEYVEIRIGLTKAHRGRSLR